MELHQSVRRARVAPSPGGLQEVAGGELGEGILGLKCQERKDKKSVQSQIIPLAMLLEEMHKVTAASPFSP